DVDYTLDASRAAAFVPEIRRYFPGLADDALRPAYVGVRCKVQAPGQPMADFVIQGPKEHGHAGLVHLMGIESPGLTACLALAEHVADCLAMTRPQP
ncbi:MAG: FAD-dependent oxidoreductase, partial [Nannocystaceae bacterium]|nr:FAD-dependent oxidoreductase [Nannocystaceae bacterium]